jgi:transposase
MMKSEVMMPDVQRRRYTDDVKMEAVRLVRESNRPAAQVARELGIADTLLYHWVAEHRQAEVQGTTRAALRPEVEELARVKRELERVTKERDCLRRAAAFFAKESR